MIVLNVNCFYKLICDLSLYWLWCVMFCLVKIYNYFGKFFYFILIVVIIKVFCWFYFWIFLDGKFFFRWCWLVFCLVNELMFLGYKIECMRKIIRDRDECFFWFIFLYLNWGGCVDEFVDVLCGVFIFFYEWIFLLNFRLLL